MNMIFLTVETLTEQACISKMVNGKVATMLKVDLGNFEFVIKFSVGCF
jgi:hypothetical protein